MTPSAKSPLRKLAIRTFIFVSLVASISCANPERTWAASQETFNTSREAILNLREAGVLGPEDMLKIDPVEKAIRGALAAAEKQLPEGGETFEYWIGIAKGGLLGLEAALNQRLDASVKAIAVEKYLTETVSNNKTTEDKTP